MSAMSREGWIVAIGACLLLLIVPYAMWSGLSPDTAPRKPRQLPRDRPEVSETWEDETEDTEALLD